MRKLIFTIGAFLVIAAVTSIEVITAVCGKLGG